VAFCFTGQSESAADCSWRPMRRLAGWPPSYVATPYRAWTACIEPPPSLKGFSPISTRSLGALTSCSYCGYPVFSCYNFNAQSFFAFAIISHAPLVIFVSAARLDGSTVRPSPSQPTDALILSVSLTLSSILIPCLSHDNLLLILTPCGTPCTLWACPRWSIVSIHSRALLGGTHHCPE